MQRDKKSRTAAGSPLERRVRPPLPIDAIWARHTTGRDEWWTCGDYETHQAGGDGLWVLRYCGKYVGKATCLEDVQRMAAAA